MANNKREVIYLACPLSDPDHEKEVQRFHLASMAAAYLMTTRDCIVFSPLSHSCPVDHYMPRHHDITGMKMRGHEFWVEIQDKYWMDCCSKLVVLALEGWNESRGVTWEEDYMEKQGKEIEMLKLETVINWYLKRKGSMVDVWI